MRILSAREQSNKRCGTRLKRDSETVERRACEARAVRAHKTLSPRFTYFFTDFEEKADCLAVYGTLKIEEISLLCFQSPIGLLIYALSGVLSQKGTQSVVLIIQDLFFLRNNKTCLEHNLKMCSLKQIQKVPIENVCTLYTAIKFSNLRSHLSSPVNI